MTWQFVASGTEGQRIRIGGVNVWEHEWQSSGEKVDVTDPLYRQHFSLDIWSIQAGRKTIRFAAGEFSNGVWGFYTEPL